MIVAVMMVRNEADVIRTNLAYHLAAGVDEFLVVDNGSTDGTGAILREFAGTGRVHVSARPGPFLQADTTTELAREAYQRGARWVLPIDADEFWHVPGGRLRDVLDDLPDAGALEVEVTNFVQRRAQERLEPAALLAMTRRPAEAVGTSAEAAALVEAGRIGFVEIRYPPKYVARATVSLRVAQGNHQVSGIDGRVMPTAAIKCLHAPLRARAALGEQKAEQGRRVEEVNQYLQQAWHVRRWRRLAEEGGLDDEWRANSYLDDRLDVHGVAHPLVVDTVLSDLVAPFIEDGSAARSDARRGTDTARARTTVGSGADTAAILDQMEGVEGWFRRDEGALLLETASAAVAGHDPAVLVEIGSYCGRSTIVLASAARKARGRARVYAIDPHEGEVSTGTGEATVRLGPGTLERFRANLAAAGVEDVVEPVRQRSHAVAWQRPIALLLIDGLHDYGNVARDFLHFERHLADGAYVAFLDCDEQFPGVRQFVSGLKGDPGYVESGRVTSLVVFQKRPVDSDADRIAALRARLGRQEAGIAYLMDQLSAKDAVIGQRDAGIEWLRSVVRDQEATIAELQKGVDWLREEVRRRQDQDRLRPHGA